MPHLVIEHSADISKKSVKNLEQNLQHVMDALVGDFKADECRTRSFSFTDYFVGHQDQSNASFIHIATKALTGRSVTVRKNLSDKIATFTKQLFLDLKLPSKRCDISVDIVEMERETYKILSLSSNNN